jgi:lipid-A-disaccharide synthase
MAAAKTNPRIFLSAGEASGDHYGAELIRVLRRTLPDAEFFGLGGTSMESAGLHRIIKAEDVAVMGITEVLLHMPRIYRSYRKLVASIRANPPQVAVLIDFPDVNLRLAKQLKKLNIPVIYLVSPQLWAWKRRRLRWVQERVSKMLVIFPFEERFYAARGVTVEFVGHPLADEPLPTISREELARKNTSIAPGGERYALDPKKPWIGLLPGSRVGEMLHNLPELVKAAYALGNEYEFLVPIAPTLTVKQISRLQFDLGSWRPADGPPPRISLVKDAAAVLFHADASVVSSGTATVLAALMGKPFIVVYKVSALSYAIAKRVIRYPEEIPAPLDDQGHPPVAMVNLIAGRRVVPELLQHRFTPENMKAALLPLLRDTPERAAMLTGLAEVRSILHPVGRPSMERAAAAVVLAMLPA